MHISNNSASTARSCWKKFYWRYNQKLTPIKQSSILALGSVVHEALDMNNKGFSSKAVIEYITKTYNDVIQGSSLSDEEDLVVARYTALGMFTHFPYKDISQFESLQSEKNIDVTLSRKCKFQGRVDSLVKKNGLWWVRELKTTGQNIRQFTQRANVSAQGTGYVWALRKMGYDVKGILYEYIKRPQLRKRMTENQDQFGCRIMEDYRIRPDNYYDQIYSYRNDFELKQWEKDMKSLVSTIRLKNRNGKYDRNTNACYNYNSECVYKKICFEPTPDPLVLQLYFRRDGQEIKGGAE